MKLGIFGLNMKAAATPEVTMRLARRCEELNYESWWAGEHVVLPSPRVPPSPLEPDDASLDPLIQLAFVAAATERMLLGTGIIIVPQRNPLVLAKQIASLDVLSAGRFVFGIGAGYLEPELTALGIAMKDRRLLTDEYLAAMRTLWYGKAPLSFDGTRTSFARIDAQPRPTHTIPIVVGGHTVGAYRRAIQQGHGWYGFWLSPKQAAEHVRGLRDLSGQHFRPADLGELEISVTPNRPLTTEMIDAYAEAGVHRLAIYPRHLEDESVFSKEIERTATLIH